MSTRFVTDFNAGDDLLHQHAPPQKEGTISLLWIMIEKAFKRTLTAQGGILMFLLVLIFTCAKMVNNDFVIVK